MQINRKHQSGNATVEIKVRSSSPRLTVLSQRTKSAILSSLAPEKNISISNYQSLKIYLIYTPGLLVENIRSCLPDTTNLPTTVCFPLVANVTFFQENKKHSKCEGASRSASHWNGQRYFKASILISPKGKFGR